MSPDSQAEKLKQMLDAEATAMAQRLAQARTDFGGSPRPQLKWLLRFAYGEGPSSPHEGWMLSEQVRELIRVATDGQWEAEGGGHYAVRLVSTRGDRAAWPKLPAHERERLEFHRAETRGEVRVAIPVETAQHAVDIATAQTAVREVVESIADGRPGSLHGGRDQYAPGLLNTSKADEAGLTIPPAGITTRVRIHWERDGGRLTARTTIRAKLPDAIRIAAVALIGKVPITLIRRCAWRACGRAFLGNKGQLYCSAHQNEARDEARKKARGTYATKHSTRAPSIRKGKGGAR
jgi:hypothetical protein